MKLALIVLLLVAAGVRDGQPATDDGGGRGAGTAQGSVFFSMTR
jgi:hypothetical protein